MSNKIVNIRAASILMIKFSKSVIFILFDLMYSSVQIKQNLYLNLDFKKIDITKLNEKYSKLIFYMIF